MLSKKLKRFNTILPKMKREIDDIGQLIQTQQYRERNYRMHVVPVNGQQYLVADAKSMNRFDHQSGRGCWRYLFDKQTNQYTGIAKEQDSGNYRVIR